jgi:acetylglutamate kinase
MKKSIVSSINNKELKILQELIGKIVLVKFGGSTMKDPDSAAYIIEDIAFMNNMGIKPVIVHGGGDDINKMLTRLDIKPIFEEGLRVTDAETIEVVEMVLAGKINKNIVNQLHMHQAYAAGITGKDCHTLICNKKIINEKDLGYVGEICEVNNRLIHSLLENSIIPVIAPIGTDPQGNTYNVNADDAASAIAASLKAEKLIYLTDVDGIFLDFHNKDSLIRKITPDIGHKLIQDGAVSGGMIPKIKNCLESLEKGTVNIHIVNGNTPHALISILVDNASKGTTFYTP